MSANRRCLIFNYFYEVLLLYLYSKKHYKSTENLSESCEVEMIRVLKFWHTTRTFWVSTQIIRVTNINITVSNILFLLVLATHLSDCYATHHATVYVMWYARSYSDSEIQNRGNVLVPNLWELTRILIHSNQGASY